MFFSCFSFFTQGCQTVFALLLAPFERELEWGGAILEITQLAFPTTPSATASYGLIDESGKWITPLGPTWMSQYREGLLASGKCDNQGKNCSYGYKDTQGNWALPPQWKERPGDFSEGFAVYPRIPFGQHTTYYRYMDKKGKIAFNGNSFILAEDFRFGLARVALRYAGKNTDGFHTYHWGWLDLSGKIYDFNEPPLARNDHPADCHTREGLFPSPQLSEEGKILWGFRNKEGKWVIPPKYISVRSFYLGKAFVQTEEGWGVMVKDQYDLIRSNGDLVFPGDKFHNPPVPNKEGLSILNVLAKPGEVSGKSYLWNGKTEKRSPFTVSQAISDSFLTDDDWIPAGEWVTDEDKVSRFQTIYFDKNWNRVLENTKEGYRIIKGEPFSEGYVLVEFYRKNDKKMKTKKGLINKKGEILFHFPTDTKYQFSPMRDGRISVYKVE